MDRRQENLEQFLVFYKETSNRLQKKLKRWCREFRKDGNPFVRTFREDLADLSQGGKLLRGVLICLGYRLGGGSREDEADALAAAFEIFQTSILVHDDVIDQAAMRRGKLTIHRRYRHRLEVRGARSLSSLDAPGRVAESAALCMGDMGLFAANLEIAKAYGDHPALGELIRCFDETAIDTIRGELLDVVLPYELQDPVIPEEERPELLERSVRDIYHLKTAVYSLIGPLRLGMILAGAAPKEMDAVGRAADELGIAYQMMDDILGIYADSELLGKDVGSDVAEFKQTILYMYVAVKNPAYLEKLLESYGRPVTEESLEAVRTLFKESGALQYATDAMNACFERADRKISRLRFLRKEDRALLRGLSAWCSRRTN